MTGTQDSVSGVREIQGPVVSRPDPTWLADAYRKQKASATSPLKKCYPFNRPTNRLGYKSGGFVSQGPCQAQASARQKRGYL